MPDLTGQILLHRYQVQAFLGRGGMAEVYRAWDRQRAAAVALKVLNEDLAGDYVFLRRFAREAQALARLDHPHIVRFFGFEETPDQAFLVMDYIEGVTLRRELKRLGRPMTLAETLAVLQPVCGALDYAHTLGVIHCDIKPANIFIERGGRVVLGDFGIARLSESATVTLSTPGTPAYMAPEQCLAAPLDGRADVYSLGIMVYEMLTLDRPFKGETYSTQGSQAERVRWEQINLPPPALLRANRALSPEVNAVVLRALEKDPARRWPTARAFWEALAAVDGAGLAAALPIYEPVETPPADTAPAASPALAAPIPLRGGAAPRRRLPGWAWMVLCLLLALGIVLPLALSSGGMDTSWLPSTEEAPRLPLATEVTPPTAAATEVTVVTATPAPTAVPTSLPLATPGPVYVAYILDASSGMAAPWEAGGESRLRAAQIALAQHWQALGPGVNIGLRAYGHRLHALDAGTCGDVERLAAVQANQLEALLAHLSGIQAQGMDSLAEVLRQVLGDFTFLPERRNAIILLSDGGDTCGGNAAQVVALQRQTGVTLPVYVIGLNVSGEPRAELERIAQNSGGRYFDVASGSELDQTLALIAQLLLEP